MLQIYYNLLKENQICFWITNKFIFIFSWQLNISLPILINKYLNKCERQTEIEINRPMERWINGCMDTKSIINV